MTSAPIDTTDKIRCFAYVMDSGYCARANTIKSYVQMNLDVRPSGRLCDKRRPADRVPLSNIDCQPWCLLSASGAASQEFLHPSCCGDQPEDSGTHTLRIRSVLSLTIRTRFQVGAECVVGEGTRVGDRASIKKSVIGKHCVIHDGVKIINSVIMNHVTISAG